MSNKAMMEVMTAATQLQAKYKKIPKLDLKTKRVEISWLLDELNRDSKASFIKERSNRDEILLEIIDSLVSWLNDIWVVVYEHNVNFSLAHACLLFTSDILDQLSESSAFGGCKCPLNNIPVHIHIKDKTKRTIIQLSTIGLERIHRVLLWIWRDLFVSLFAKGNERERKKVPDMLEDIESTLGVDALENLLRGGNSDDEDFDPDDEGDYDDELEDEHASDDGTCSGDELELDYESDGSNYSLCGCRFHASYWPERLNRERITLRASVEERLFKTFTTTPSLRTYNNLMGISQDVIETELRLAQILSENAGSTRETLIAALNIHITNGDQDEVALLLKQYSYLLRPRDCTTLQLAVAILEDAHHHIQSLSTLEKELEDSMRAIYATVGSCFSHIEEDRNKKELLAILKLPSGSSARKERMESWSEQVATTSAMHPMAFAAAMIGLPMMPGMDEGEDADLLHFVDLDPSDPDLDDLREEYRPNLKGRFDGWVQLAQAIKGGNVMLAKLYLKAVELMPWLRGADAVAELMNRLRERPNKNHVVEALSNFSAFGKTQRKKLNLARAEQQRRTAKAQTSSGAANGGSKSASSPGSCSTSPPPPVVAHTFPETGGALSFTFGPPPVHGPAPPPLPFPFVRGGMEDVD
ncbi:hypothetical protein B0H34DRAFT_209831 [Crassisporium funariophilum]|nr:hypothetical protein B0H34DRAFT_209831 [Crassisporium funariophilum]